MEQYAGKICPFCKREIQKEDAVKVCPDCGTPQHETCWEQNKGCASDSCTASSPGESSGSFSADSCQNCGSPIDCSQAFCGRCGAKNPYFIQPAKKYASSVGQNYKKISLFVPIAAKKLRLKVL